MIHDNVKTDFCDSEYSPDIDTSSFVHPLAAVIGHVIIRGEVMVAPGASIRGDEGHPLFIGHRSNVQDGVVIHGLETESNGVPVEDHLVEIEGTPYSVYVGKRVSLAHQSQIHGPASVGDDTFVGMNSLVFKSRVGERCVIEPSCTLIGVCVEPGRYVPAGTVLTRQEDADRLPAVSEDYPLGNLNNDVVHVNTGLAEGYIRKGISSP